MQRSGWTLSAAETAPSQSQSVRFPATDAGLEAGFLSHFNVRAYEIEGSVLLATNILTPIFSKYTGTNVSLEKLVQAASDIQSAYRANGHPAMSVVIGQRRVLDGLVTLSVFHGAFPQIVVFGRRYLISGDGIAVAPNPSAAEFAVSPETSDPAVASTNTGPTFTVEKYLVMGNYSLLSPGALAEAVTNVPGAFGTNVSLKAIQTALTQLQQAYRRRGYVTVSVGLPQQKLTNATVKVQVMEGRLEAISVVGNRYFSSNNVMRALPSLHTNIILNGLVFQSELNRANANQDRQIYLPVISPGSQPGSSDLTLKIKDRLPLHGKLELNNESSPGTPDLRVNASAAYNNLWQHEHSVGIQYGFSPESYKSGKQWDFYDAPLVANYGAFYRMPLGNPEAVATVIASDPGNFGYSEAERKFILPPPSGQPELTLYASRATIDTGVESLSSATILDIPGVRQITRDDVQQDITINEALGFRLTESLRGTESFRATLSEGMEFKHYFLNDYKTNTFNLSEITYDANGNQNPPVVSTVNSPVPPTLRLLDYLPLTVSYNPVLHTPRTTFAFGLGVSVNTWYSGSKSDLQTITSSTRSSGHWVTMDPSLSGDIVVYTNWVLSVRANGRWASEPLISNEQFGAGGVASVRGYHEGEVFGDTGWRVSLEQKTPPYSIGSVGGKLPFTVRGAIYMDYADTRLLDAQGRPGNTALWGTGFGAVASLGSYWEARFLFSLPLLNAGKTSAYQPFFNFALSSQF